MNLKSFQSEKGYFSKKLTESETTVIETRMKIQRALKEEKDQDPGEPQHSRNPKRDQGRHTSKGAEGPSGALWPGLGGDLKDKAKIQHKPQRHPKPQQQGTTGAADGASSGGLGGGLTGSTKGAQQISSWDSPHTFILYLPRTFPFSNHCSKKNTCEKSTPKRMYMTHPGTQPRTVNPWSC